MNAPRCLYTKERRLTSAHNRLDLRDHTNIDDAGNVKGTDAVDQAQVQGTQVEGSQVKLVEDASLCNGQKSLQLLKLEQGIDVEGADVEEVLEGKDVEVVLESQLLKETKVEGTLVERKEVAQVLLPEVEVVDALGIKDAALKDGESNGSVDFGFGDGGGGRGGGDKGGESAGEDGGQLHGEMGVKKN